MPKLGHVVFLLILWHPLFHHKGKQNPSSGKDFNPSVPQWHLVSSHIFHDPFVLWSPIVSYMFHFPLLHPACAHTTFLSLLYHIFYIFPNGFSFQTNPVVFYTPFGLTCCIRLTNDWNSLRLFHIFYIDCFLGSYQSFLLCYWFLQPVPVWPLVRLKLFFLSTLFLPISTDLHLLYPLFIW